MREEERDQGSDRGLSQSALQSASAAAPLPQTSAAASESKMSRVPQAGLPPKRPTKQQPALPPKRPPVGTGSRVQVRHRRTPTYGGCPYPDSHGTMNEKPSWGHSPDSPSARYCRETRDAVSRAANAGAEGWQIALIDDSRMQGIRLY